jgi:hypothetical protein
LIGNPGIFFQTFQSFRFHRHLIGPGGASSLFAPGWVAVTLTGVTPRSLKNKGAQTDEQNRHVAGTDDFPVNQLPRSSFPEFLRDESVPDD